MTPNCHQGGSCKLHTLDLVLRHCDDYNLTHGGARIDDIDKFDDPKSDDDEDAEELLGKEFVDEAHFGGFMSRADDEFKAGKGNSRKEYIENLIRESTSFQSFKEMDTY